MPGRKIDATINSIPNLSLIKLLISTSNNKRPAIDTVMLIKMMLLGYLFGISVNNMLVQEIYVYVNVVKLTKWVIKWKVDARRKETVEKSLVDAKQYDSFPLLTETKSRIQAILSTHCFDV